MITRVSLLLCLTTLLFSSPGHAQLEAAPACVPDCREGYTCQQGECIYACNPICAPGYGCLSNGSCVPMPLTVAPVPVINPDPIAELNRQQQEQEMAAQKAAERAAAAAARKEYRRSPRFTLHMGASILGSYDTDASGWGGTLGLGFRKNFADYFGLQIRFNTTFGTFQQPYYHHEDEVYPGVEYIDLFITAIDGEVIPIFGPFGHFYFGPIIFVGGIWYNDDILFSDIYPADNQTPEGFLSGAGLDMGILVGPRDMIDINCRFKSAFFTEDMPFYIQFGVAIHFMKIKR